MCDVLQFTRRRIHLIYEFYFHIYVAMHLFDVVCFRCLKN
jgi:hypothetical protein